MIRGFVRIMKKNEFIPWAQPVFWGNEKKYVDQALSSTWISGGSFVERLENEFSEYVRSQFALTVCNGTSAIQLAYLALDLKPGDEVIVPGFAFMAAANVAMSGDAARRFKNLVNNKF